MRIEIDNKLSRNFVEIIILACGINDKNGLIIFEERNFFNEPVLNNNDR